MQKTLFLSLCLILTSCQNKQHDILIAYPIGYGFEIELEEKRFSHFKAKYGGHVIHSNIFSKKLKLSCFRVNNDLIVSSINENNKRSMNYHTVIGVDKFEGLPVLVKLSENSFKLTWNIKSISVPGVGQPNKYIRGSFSGNTDSVVTEEQTIIFSWK